jgi:hypothetical protein
VEETSYDSGRHSRNVICACWRWRKRCVLFSVQGWDGITAELTTKVGLRRSDETGPIDFLACWCVVLVSCGLRGRKSRLLRDGGRFPSTMRGGRTENSRDDRLYEREKSITSARCRRTGCGYLLICS